MTRAALFFALFLAFAPAGGGARACEANTARITIVCQCAPARVVIKAPKAPRRRLPRNQTYAPPAITKAAPRTTHLFLLYRSILC